MARINTNVTALIAQDNLRRANQNLELSLQRLSTGLRINRGADDPAGLIASETLRAEISSMQQAIENSQRAINVIRTTEGALNEVSALLLDIKALILEAANSGALSDDEIAANQLQIDSAIDSITRIANTTSFAGRKLLDGSLDYVTSGVVNSKIVDLRIDRAKFGSRASIPVQISVASAAEQAILQFRSSQTTAAVELRVAGPDGVVTIPLGSGVSASQIVETINGFSDATGVEALLINSANPDSGVTFRSKSFGSEAFVRVEVVGGDDTLFPVTNEDGITANFDEGRDVAATVNGVLVRGRGLEVTFRSSTLSIVANFDSDFNVVGSSTNFTITRGGALYQLGPRIDTNLQESLGVPSIAANRLGSNAVGFLSQLTTGGELDLRTIAGRADLGKQAGQIVDEAINQIASLRGRLGAFERNTLETNINQLTITLENLISSESAIRDTDFAVETSELTRQQILANAGVSVLALANTLPQQALALLGG